MEMYLMGALEIKEAGDFTRPRPKKQAKRCAIL
jgi:hypothetical protein